MGRIINCSREMLGISGNSKEKGKQSCIRIKITKNLFVFKKLSLLIKPTHREPDVLAAGRAVDPSLSVVARQHNADTGDSDPRGQHEGSVQPQQQLAGLREACDIREGCLLSTGHVDDVMVAHTVRCNGSMVTTYKIHNI